MEHNGVYRGFSKNIGGNTVPGNAIVIRQNENAVTAPRYPVTVTKGNGINRLTGGEIGFLYRIPKSAIC